MSRGSLRLRLLAAGAVSVVVALSLSALGLTLLFERHVERRVAAELSVYLDQVTAGLDLDSGGALAVLRPPTDPRFARPLSGLYWQILTGEGRLRSRSLWDVELALPGDAPVDGELRVHRIPGPSATSHLIVERRVILPARLGGDGVRIAVGLDRAELSAATRAFGADLVPYLALIAVLLIVASWAQVTVGLRPLVAVKERLTAIRSGARDRLGVAFPDEVKPLALEVDGLLDSRDAQIDKARARAADLAHGLKTPLQVLVGDAARLREAGEVAIADEIEDVAGAMRRHVDRELARARLATGQGYARAAVGAIVERIVAVLRRTPDGARLDWTVNVAPDLSARIDREDLAEALGNLAENAARHARGAVTITASGDGGVISIIVGDDGPGIPDDRIGDVLSRGVRIDTSRGGAGLGLAIAREIAEAWGGSLRIANATLGLEAELRLTNAG